MAEFPNTSWLVLAVVEIIVHYLVRRGSNIYRVFSSCLTVRQGSNDRICLVLAQSRFDANESVSHHDLQTHGLMLVRKEDPHFKASSGWAIRFGFVLFIFP